MAIKGGFDASGRVLARGSAPINYFIIGTVGCRYGMNMSHNRYSITLVQLCGVLVWVWVGMVPTTINYFIMATVGYGIYNKLSHCIADTVGFGMGIGVHMSHNKLYHHPLPDLTAYLSKSQLMVRMRIKKIVVME